MGSKVIYTIAVASMVLLCQAILANSQGAQVTDVCLGCICEAVSGCDQSRKCNGDVCGLFHITWAYWSDAGKLTLNGEDPSSTTAYQNCAYDPYCAANTIQNYMRKYGQDCNGDGAIDCYDYAAIHKLGGYGCKNALTGDYPNVLGQCLAKFN